MVGYGADAAAASCPACISVHGKSYNSILLSALFNKKAIGGRHNRGGRKPPVAEEKYLSLCRVCTLMPKILKRLAVIF